MCQRADSVRPPEHVACATRRAACLSLGVMSAFISSSEVGKPDIPKERYVVDFATQRQQLRMHEIFGFNGALIRDEVIARAAAVSRSYVGGLYPPSAPGSLRWIHTVAALREALAFLGYEASEEGQLSRTIHRERQIAILPSTGSRTTGIPFHVARQDPSTKWPKGERTAEAVRRNSQPTLFGDDDEPADEIVGPNFDTWILLQHAAEDEVRAELSLPAEIDDRGFIRKWTVRLILPPHSNDGGPVDEYDDEAGDDSIDVPVEPK